MSTIDTSIHLTVDEASHELYSVVTEVNAPHLAFTFLAGFILVFGMFSALIKERLYAGEAIVATGFGIIFGPHCADLVDPRSWGSPSFDDVTLEFTRIVLALSVFAVGVELPRAYVKRHWRSLFMVLVPLMIAGWLITAGLIYGLIPGLSFLGALVVAACMTPTDPILAASVVGKGKFAQKHVPSHIRHLLQCESGCNDGAAFPFLYLALFLLFRESHSVGEAIGWWIVLVILYQILLGIIIGIIVGVVARKVLKFSKRRSLIDRESMVAMYVSLAIFTTAATTLAGSDDLLAAFACGAAFAWDDWFSESIEDSNFSNILDLLVNCVVFVYIGATIPFSDFNNPIITLVPWRLAVLGICIILIRRLPSMLLIYKWIPDIKTFREAVFAGWFGPIGVGAVFIATLALTKLPTPNVPPETSDDILALTIQPIVYFMVLCSVIVHGSSIPFFNLGKRVHSIHRTWTQTSNQEPSWLSRVKRVGDGGDDIEVNRDEGSGSPGSNEKEKGRMRGGHGPDDIDLEAGETVIDDAGMDVGDMSAKDYATVDVDSSDPRHGRNAEKAVTSDAGTSPRRLQKGKKSHRVAGSEDEASDEDVRRERHDSSDDEDEEVWDEGGGDVVVESRHGEDTRTYHNGHLAEQDRHHDESRSSGQGGGFPGHRFAEIQHLIEQGHDLAFNKHRKTSNDNLPAISESPRAASRQSQRPSERALAEATERVANSKERETKQKQEQLDKAMNEGRPAAGKDAGGSGPSKTEGGSNPAKATTSPAFLSSLAKLPSVRPKPHRRSTLTPEEKYARDAWCRKERKDVDDDEVKAWVSGKHLVIERNNGEDVEIIDANPSRAAREQARKAPNLNVKALPIDEVNAAKSEVVTENYRIGPTGPSGSASKGKQDHPKRFDLKKFADVSKYSKIFGLDSREHHGTSERPSTEIVREEPEEEEAATGQRRAEDAEGSPTEPRITWAASADEAPSTSASTIRRPNRGPSGEESNPNYLSTRKTGIPLAKTDTTDSQVRFAALPKGKRK